MKNLIENLYFLIFLLKHGEYIDIYIYMFLIVNNTVDWLNIWWLCKHFRWWQELGVNKMTFFRDRLMEFFLWCCIIAHEPQYGSFRIRLTKVSSMITVIDDVYDIYGTLDELELLTDFIERYLFKLNILSLLCCYNLNTRKIYCSKQSIYSFSGYGHERRWDITGIDKLPPTISTTFLALFNTTNAVGLEIQMESGFNPIPYIQRMVVNNYFANFLITVIWFIPFLL